MNNYWERERRAQVSLYPGQREALTLWGEGHSYREIGILMGIKASSVAPYLVGARLALSAATMAEAYDRAKSLGWVPYSR